MLIGSRALAFHDPLFAKHINDQTDWDIIGDSSTPHVEGVELHRVDQYLSEEALQFATDQYVVIDGIGRVPVCSLRGLAAIKRSHLSLDWKWTKHITQYHFHLKHALDSQDQDFVKRREKITLQAAKQRAPSLKKTKDQFFDDYVQKKYDHDMLHGLVAFYEAPLYTRLQKTEEVYCDRGLWNALSHRDKVFCVAEETHVIAIERFCIPSKWTYFPRRAYSNALNKVCTTLTSGWFRDFAIDFYPEIYAAYSKDIFGKVQQICP